VREQSEMQVAITLYEVLYKKAFQGETFRGEMGFRMSVDLIRRECDKVVVELTCAGPLRLLDLMYGTAGGGGIFSTCFGS
jgi:hypothetical protein